jgi:hypothetical protein
MIDIVNAGPQAGRGLAGILDFGAALHTIRIMGNAISPRGDMPKHRVPTM